MTKVEDMALSYSGAWFHIGDPFAGMHSRHDSDGEAEANASAFWRGYCRGFELYGARGELGIAEIYVDGTLHGEADFYSEEMKSGELICAVSGLPEGLHTIELRKAGRKNPRSSGTGIALDYLKIDLTAPAKRPFGSILCVGDSITYGSNVKDRMENVYGGRLQRMLRAPVAIHGLPSATIGEITKSLDEIVDRIRPDLVLWLAGMNNPNPLAELEAGFERLRELAPQAEIMAATIPYNTYYTEEQNARRVCEVKQACLNKGVPCIDLYRATAGNDYINMPEGTVHPNDEGQAVIAGLFYSAIMERYYNETRDCR